MLLIPSFARPLLDQFAPVFFHPTYQRFLLLTVAAILTTGRRTVSNLLRTVGDLQHGDPSSYQHVLSMRHWSTMALARISISVILDHYVGDGPVMLAGDDTVDEHRGVKVYGKGRIATRSARPTRTPPSAGGTNGSSWRSSSRSPSRPAPGLCPSWWRVSLRGQGPGHLADTKARGQRQDQGQGQRRKPSRVSRDASGRVIRRHKTPAELMRQLLAVLIHWFPDRQFVLAADGGYATHALARFAQRPHGHVSLVSLFYPDANLYEPPPVVGKTNGRPRKKGKSSHPPRSWWGQSPRERLEVSWYGGGRREVEVVRGTGHWYKGGEGLVPLTWVYRPRPDGDASRHLPVQYRRGDGDPHDHRDLHGSLVDRDDLRRMPRLPGPGDDTRSYGADRAPRRTVPVRFVLGGVVALRRDAGTRVDRSGRDVSR